MKIEIEVEEAVYKFLERMASYKGLTVSDYVSAGVNASILFSLAHREELHEHYTQKIKEDKKKSW